MKRRLALLVLPALALAGVLASAQPSYAQRHGGGGHGGYRGGYYGGGYGRGYGYGGLGYGGLGYGGLGYGGLGYGGLGYGGLGFGLGYGLGRLGYGGWGYGGYGGYYGSPGYYASSGYYTAPAYYSTAPAYYDVTPSYSDVAPATYGGTYAYSPPANIQGGSSVVPAAGYQAFYPPSGSTQTPAPMAGPMPAPAPGAANGTSAIIHVRVPANAQVFFDNTATTQSGPDRVFATPPLDLHQTYSYQISARWMQNGKEVRQDRTVQLTPGRSVDVDFVSAQGGPAPQAAATGGQFVQPGTPATPNGTPAVNPAPQTPAPGVSPAVNPGVAPSAPAQPKQASPGVQPPL